MVNRFVFDINLVSGGQKTIISACFIFAIQMNDPCLFYVFDEIYANLDQAYREKLYQIVKNSTAQYFATSFREESFIVADKNFCIISKNKKSFIDEIGQKLAFETIRVE